MVGQPKRHRNAPTNPITRFGSTNLFQRPDDLCPVSITNPTMRMKRPVPLVIFRRFKTTWTAFAPVLLERAV
jgi:hypothetical protein